MGYVILLWHSLSLPYNYLDCKIMFVTSLIMLVGTEADVIVVEMGFTAPQQFSGHMECSGLS